MRESGKAYHRKEECSVGAHHPANVKRDAERNGIEAQWNAVAVIEFQIKVFGFRGFEFNSGVEPIIPSKACASGRYVLAQVAFAICGCSRG